MSLLDLDVWPQPRAGGDVVTRRRDPGYEARPRRQRLAMGPSRKRRRSDGALSPVRHGGLHAGSGRVPRRPVPQNTARGSRRRVERGGVCLGEGGDRRRIGVIVGRYVDGLHRGDGTDLG